ncbi:MAG: hypothetical protein IKO91_08330 [Oscillospiraceae bacterium]|nr:hypothetical protein [Oscillospiraceae bacterium]
MSYPSLLFSDRASGVRVEPHVFEDVKLTAFFSEESVGAMRILCRPEDIPLRQELLRFLSEDPASGRTLQELSGITVELQRLHAALQDVKCENERHYVFVGLMAAVADFAEKAAGLPKESGALLRRFGARFRADAANPEWSRLAERARSLREKAEIARRETFRMAGDNLWMRPDYRESYVDRLLRCADELGLEPMRPRRDVSLRLDARMVNALARLHPEAFLAFREFYTEFGGKFDETILSYRFELNFYLEALALMERIRAAGLPLCWPETSSRRRLEIRELYDISLLLKEGVSIVPNDALFTEEEPFFFLTGANGGGKTTYLRAIGIAVLLYLSGCPVCAETAEIRPFRSVFTHFPKDERFEADGRYADEQKRVGGILASHGGDSLILLNETYSTTNEELAVSSTLELTEKLKSSGSFTLYITHQRGLESAGVPFLSVIVDARDQNRRTYRIARRKEFESSFALDILRRYSLDEESLIRRFPGEEAGA